MMKLKDVPALESVFNGLDDGMDKTNVAGTLKQLGSKTVNDWIERQRMQSDIRQVQNLYNRGDKARAQSYASIVGVRIGESLQATPNTTGKTVSRVVDLRSDTERKIESQTGNVLAPEREQLAREMTAFLKTHDTGNNAEHYREFRDRFHKRSEAIAEGSGYHQALLEIYHRIQKLCKEQGVYFHSGGVDHVFEGNYWHN